MKPYIDSNGYCQVDLKSKAHLVHRLVAEHFLPKPSEYLIQEAQKTKNKKVLVNHKDGNKQNNNEDNLEWTTYSDNSKHSFIVGTQTPCKGELNNNSKLSEMDVYEIRNKYNNAVKDFILSMTDEYDMSVDAIEDIVYNRTWKHLL